MYFNFFFRKSVVNNHEKALGDNLQALIFLLMASNKILKLFEIKLQK